MIVRALIAATSIAMFFVVYLLSGWYGPTERLDLAILRMLEIHGTPVLLWAVSVPSLMLCSIVVVLIAVRRNKAMLGVRAFAILAACNVLGQVLKDFVLERDAIATSQGNSFPSGHMIAFASVALALWIVLPHVMRGVYTVVASLLLSVVAFELVHYGWHRPSDVIGSMLLVTAVGAIGGAASASRERHREEEPQPILPPGA
ncbi:phosphatase PAP2 family protein [Brachybacterium endophyticum]|nr:phosphatase PAP2 family protein [Brachybacterium endophyticum]